MSLSDSEFGEKKQGEHSRVPLEGRVRKSCEKLGVISLVGFFHFRKAGGPESLQEMLIQQRSSCPFFL